MVNVLIVNVIGVNFFVIHCSQVDDDYKLLQRTDAQVVDDITKKYSDELSATVNSSFVCYNLLLTL